MLHEANLPAVWNNFNSQSRNKQHHRTIWNRRSCCRPYAAEDSETTCEEMFDVYLDPKIRQGQCGSNTAYFMSSLSEIQLPSWCCTPWPETHKLWFYPLPLPRYHIRFSQSVETLEINGFLPKNQQSGWFWVPPVLENGNQKCWPILRWFLPWLHVHPET